MKKTILAVTILSFSVAGANAQGCSDAGVCTIHSIKNNTWGDGQEEKANTVVAGFAFGKGEDNVSYYSPYLEYTRAFKSGTALTAKFNYVISDGRLAKTSGISDVFITASQAFDKKKAVRKSFILGVKIPLDNAAIRKGNIELPMPYQPSLGTYDLITGFNFFYKSFGATAAFQIPVINENRNKFLPSDYPSHPFISEYLPTNQFKRKADGLLRVSYNKELNKKFSIRPSLLGIYHFDDDTYVNSTGQRVNIFGSKGLTLNGNVFFSMKTSKANEFELALGTPFVVRPSRPDGLTRSFVASLDYRISF